MKYEILDNYTYKELVNLCKELNIESYKTKLETKKNIIKTLKKYEKHKKKNIDRYEKIKQLGNKGKDGIVFLVKEKKSGEYYAMKTFKKNKSEKKILLEYELQKIASEYDISPKVYNIDTVDNYIIMEKMDSHLFQKMEKNNRQLNISDQKKIIKLYKNLDKAKVFHGDVNILNYMFKDKKLYMIDFGMSKKIDDNLIKKLGTDKPNLNIMTLGLILKLKELGCSSNSYKYLMKYISEKEIIKYNI